MIVLSVLTIRQHKPFVIRNADLRPNLAHEEHQNLIALRFRNLYASAVCFPVEPTQILTDG